MQPSQPYLVAVRLPKAPPNRPAQPGLRRKGSVKSAKSLYERQKKGHKRDRSSQETPSQSAGGPKQISSQQQRSRSKSVRKSSGYREGMPKKKKIQVQEALSLARTPL